jgi:hypothetical protein
MLLLERDLTSVNIPYKASVKHMELPSPLERSYTLAHLFQRSSMKRLEVIFRNSLPLSPLDKSPIRDYPF